MSINNYSTGLQINITVQYLWVQLRQRNVTMTEDGSLRHDYKQMNGERGVLRSPPQYKVTSQTCLQILRWAHLKGKLTNKKKKKDNWGVGLKIIRALNKNPEWYQNKYYSICGLIFTSKVTQKVSDVEGFIIIGWPFCDT